MDGPLCVLVVVVIFVVVSDDIIRAIKKLRVLGSGFAVIPIGDRRLIQSVPGELSMDHTAVLQHAEVNPNDVLPCHSMKAFCIT